MYNTRRAKGIDYEDVSEEIGSRDIMPSTHFLMSKMYTAYEQGLCMNLPGDFVSFVAETARRTRFDPVATLMVLCDRFETMFDAYDEHDPTELQEITDLTQSVILPWIVSTNIDAAYELYFFFRDKDTMCEPWCEFIQSNLIFEIRKVARDGIQEVFQAKYPALDLSYLHRHITDYICI